MPVVLQGKLRGARRFQTFADTTLEPPRHVPRPLHVPLGGSRGRTFVFRARIRRAPGFPYETGVTRTVRVRVR